MTISVIRNLNRSFPVYQKCLTSLFLSAVLFLSPVVMKSYAQQDDFSGCFLELYEDIKDPDNGYFSSHGIPYHSVETMMIEAPDYGHETTSEAVSYYVWLEVMYGRLTGDWSGVSEAWRILEEYFIPSHEDQPTNDGYNPSSPASYTDEKDLPQEYPPQLQTGVPVGIDPISEELEQTYGTSDIYGMHWLLDVDNWYGYGQRGDGTSSPSFINTFQRGRQESVWETVPHPSWEGFEWGGENGFLDLFIGDNNYAEQWRYTNAPDADARAIQAVYWAARFTEETGGEGASLPIDEASKLGDYLRYSFFDKYFKPIGCQDVFAGAPQDPDSSKHYLLSWYYSWGGSSPDAAGSWAFRIGCSHIHFGYQDPLTAWVLSTRPEFQPQSEGAVEDWEISLQRQIELYGWLQSDEGAFAGGVTNSVNGRYGDYPSGASTFYNMVFEEHPVYADPGSNSWFGWQAWSVERLAEYYYVSGDERAGSILDKWVSWVKSVVVLGEDSTYSIPATLEWEGQPEPWTGTIGPNPDLHVTVKDYSQDIGITACLAKALTYYAAATREHGALDEDSRDLARELLLRVWYNYRDGKGISSPEKRGDYHRMFDQEVYIPEGWQGVNGMGDTIEPGVTFIDIRSKYRDDPDFERVKEAVDNGEDPEFTYHRFWAQVDCALAFAEYGRFFNDEGALSARPAAENIQYMQAEPVRLIRNAGKLIVDMNGQKNVKVRLTDTKGRTLYEKMTASENMVALPASSLPGGIYCLSIEYGNNSRNIFEKIFIAE